MKRYCCKMSRTVLFNKCVPKNVNFLCCLSMQTNTYECWQMNDQTDDRNEVTRCQPAYAGHSKQNNISYMCSILHAFQVTYVNATFISSYLFYMTQCWVIFHKESCNSYSTLGTRNKKQVIKVKTYSVYSGWTFWGCGLHSSYIPYPWGMCLRPRGRYCGTEYWLCISGKWRLSRSTMTETQTHYVYWIILVQTTCIWKMYLLKRNIVS